MRLGLSLLYRQLLFKQEEISPKYLIIQYKFQEDTQILKYTIAAALQLSLHCHIFITSFTSPRCAIDRGGIKPINLPFCFLIWIDRFVIKSLKPTQLPSTSQNTLKSTRILWVGFEDSTSLCSKPLARAARTLGGVSSNEACEDKP